jgi:PTH1 family peptidyl-tRNA hydrolase
VKIVAGLGNPGREYEGTRHNAGFVVVDRLAREHRIRLGAGRGDFLTGSGRIGGTQVTLMVPLTFMNLSGRAVAEILEAKDAAPGELLVICDDVWLELGQLRIRRRGGDGGHNGLASVIECLDTEDFPRLRLGVGMPEADIDMADFVLDRFLTEELPVVETMVEEAARAVEGILRDGIDRTMNVVNRKAVREVPPDSEEA